MMIVGLQSHLCLFSGWLRELHGPGFLEVVVPQLLSRKVWVVSCNMLKDSICYFMASCSTFISQWMDFHSSNLQISFFQLFKI